jgi:hypothetical protein
MDEFTTYLDETNKAQFCNWLSVYCKKKQVENRQYPHQDGWTYNFYYPFPISPDFQSELGINAMFSRYALIEASEDAEKYMSDNFDIENAVTISWLEVGERLKVTVDHKSGGLTCPPLFDMLAEIGKDWPETRRDAWDYVQKQAKKYHIELTGQPFPLDDEAKIKENSYTFPSLANIATVLIQQAAKLSTGVILTDADMPKTPEEQRQQAEEAKRFRAMRYGKMSEISVVQPLPLVNQDRLEKVLELSKQHQTIVAIAHELNVSVSTVKRDREALELTRKRNKKKKVSSP